MGVGGVQMLVWGMGGGKGGKGDEVCYVGVFEDLGGDDVCCVSVCVYLRERGGTCLGVHRGSVIVGASKHHTPIHSHFPPRDLSVF